LTAVAAARRLLLVALFSLVHAAPARAEWQFAVSPFLGYTFGSASNLVDFDLISEDEADDTRLSFSSSVRWIGSSPFGIEGLYAHTPGFFDAQQASLVLPRVLTSRAYALMGNVVLATPASWNRYGLRPSLSGGLGLIHAAAIDQSDILPFNLNMLGMNVGGGAVGFLTDHIGLRFDLRYFQNLTGSADDLEVPVTFGEPVRLHFWTASVGIVFKM
jgi:hypothetical protein